MSVQAMTWALEQQAITDASARHVLLCLANYADKTGRAAFPSASTLSRDTGLSERTVRSKLDLLETAGAILKGNQAIVAAYIERADKRPICFDLVMTLSGEPGAAAAPRKDGRGANGAGTGCNPREHGVQSTHERGAAIAGNPSFDPSTNPSFNPKDSASPSGAPDLFPEPPAIPAPRAEKKAKPEAFDAMAYLVAAGVDVQVAHDWLTVRKKKNLPPTLTALQKLERDGAAAGKTFAQTVTHCAERGHAGFYPDRDSQAASVNRGTGFMSKQERAEAENARRRAERETSKAQPIEHAVPLAYAIPQQRPMLLGSNQQNDDLGF
ncbi:helix-turn-helix domain-containing protein [Paraburkholderia strydomiana]